MGVSGIVLLGELAPSVPPHSVPMHGEESRRTAAAEAPNRGISRIYDEPNAVTLPLHTDP